MQLVEQCLEFVVGNVGAGIGCRRCRCSGRSIRRRRGHGVGRELAFAMQLVEQGFEFRVGNVFAGRRGDRRRRNRRFSLSLDCVERVEQLLEFAVGHIRLGWRHRLRLGLHRRRLGSRFGQARQGGQQFRGGGSDRRTFAHFTEHAVDRIQCFENHVHQFRVNLALTLAQDVEHVLGDVTALHQLMELEEAGAPFYSVKTAKNCIEQVRIIRAAFQLDQLFGQLL
ncbi:hypothetical protein [Pseudomonas sp. 44 R 15]|nr:hypothetical protein [Pseudomonas sp. 44 R 15]